MSERWERCPSTHCLRRGECASPHECSARGLAKPFLHIMPKADACDHDFQGFRAFEDGNGGEQVCTRCGMGAMAYSLAMNVMLTPEQIGKFHPIQVSDVTRYGRSFMPSEVTLRAYEVYCHLFGEQDALIDFAGRGCRSGFGVGELVAFLYARSFPKQEWQQRFDEALRQPPR